MPSFDKLGKQALRQTRMLKVMATSGVIRPYGPRKLLGIATTLQKRGIGFAGGMGALAVRSGDEIGLVDELGELTWREVDERATRLARGLHGVGVSEGDSVAVLCRNHRYFVDVSTALSKLGADILYLNTAFSAPQLGEVCAREKPVAIVFDDEFTELVDKSEVDLTRVVAWHDGEPDGSSTLVEDLIEGAGTDEVAVPGHTTRPVILTSGTTGTPKGAPRDEAGIDGAVALLSRMPLRTGGRTYIAAPLFHTWGWAHLNLAMLLGSTLVLRRKFDPAEALQTLREQECDAMVVIPVMMQRILKLPESERSGDWSFLKVVAASGSALPGDLATEWMDAFGENLYNTYGSTEVAWATIAQPQDMRDAPGTAGKPPYNTVVKIYDEDGNPVEQGDSGRIFVGNTMLFGGYTGDTDEKKDMVDGLMSSGDVGRFDDQGRLFVEGRDDEMIVSGGENVFPQEVEDCLSRHEAVSDVAAIGVDDDDYGTRLRAFVVTSGDVDEETLKGHVKENLARYKVPREIVFLDELPRNATGKILKKDLKDYDAEGNPGAGSGQDSGQDSGEDSGQDSDEARGDDEQAS
ncbi:AMP-binding protein [Nocardioides aurantiacus]|uniref:Fatty-acyl-CoA synthase n=1 Tax=Nocardioides aurantiacus TaxID=86796 RepID=A0A3N2CS30_9ACTN|nr:AMP-binding protein [Nocardioides aurantiacus]ROR90347.1 fatty-acyl-CoA synthase [Nocardioides aurantiacus]